MVAAVSVAAVASRTSQAAEETIVRKVREAAAGISRLVTVVRS